MKIKISLPKDMTHSIRVVTTSISTGQDQNVQDGVAGKDVTVDLKEGNRVELVVGAPIPKSDDESAAKA